MRGSRSKAGAGWEEGDRTGVEEQEEGEGSDLGEGKDGELIIGGSKGNSDSTVIAGQEGEEASCVRKVRTGALEDGGLDMEPTLKQEPEPALRPAWIFDGE